MASLSKPNEKPSKKAIQKCLLGKSLSCKAGQGAERAIYSWLPLTTGKHQAATLPLLLGFQRPRDIHKTCTEMAQAFLRECKYLAVLPSPKGSIAWPFLFTVQEQRLHRQECRYLRNLNFCLSFTAERSSSIPGFPLLRRNLCFSTHCKQESC